MERPLLFLDVDGVLNSIRSIYAFRTGGNPLRAWMLDEETGAGIVLCSSWRGSGPAQTAAWMVHYGWYECPVVGETPRLWTDMRGDEIRKWREDHDADGTYAILDDSTDYYEDQPLVHVDGDVGVTRSEYDECKRLLSQE